MTAILPGAPWLIAHKSMLGINQPKKITLNGQDYVIWQNQKGEVCAINNVCPHLQAPLSEGWVCKEKNTIVCPFHAIEFDGTGRLYKEGKQNTQPLTKSLDLIVQGDYIWTYGGFEPKLQIPNLIAKIEQEYELIGVCGEKSIQADFLSTLMVNYDYNHQNGTHKEMFQITSCDVKGYETNGYNAKVQQEIKRADNSWQEILQNPALLIIPKLLNNTLEYTFPSTTALFATAPVGNIVQTHILYPETTNQTKTFVLFYGKFKNPVVKFLFRKSLLETGAKIVEQDSKAVEHLYPREKPKLRLPNEEIMYDAEKLYRNW